MKDVPSNIQEASKNYHHPNNNQYYYNYSKIFGQNYFIEEEKSGVERNYPNPFHYHHQQRKSILPFLI
jgi:hypothetical protein